MLSESPRHLKLKIDSSTMATLGNMRQSLSVAGGRGALERLGMLVFPLLLLFDLLSTAEGQAVAPPTGKNCTCLLYTSDAADES